MLPTPTKFPNVGSYALLRIASEAHGRTTSVRLRRVRIQQHNRDGSLLVTAPEARIMLGHRRVNVPAIQKTVQRSDLRRLPRRLADGNGEQTTSPRHATAFLACRIA